MPWSSSNTKTKKNNNTTEQKNIIAKLFVILGARLDLVSHVGRAQKREWSRHSLIDEAQAYFKRASWLCIIGCVGFGGGVEKRDEEIEPQFARGGRSNWRGAEARVGNRHLTVYLPLSEVPLLEHQHLTRRHVGVVVPFVFRVLLEVNIVLRVSKMTAVHGHLNEIIRVDVTSVSKGQLVLVAHRVLHR